MLKKFLMIIMTIFLVSACDPSEKNIFAPNKRLLRQVPEGSKEHYPDYAAGWLAGCETGMATGFGNDFYKMFYKFTKDHKMVESGNKHYLRAWSSAMIFCRHFCVGTLKEAGMTPRLPGEGFALPLDKHSIFGNAMHPAKHGAIGLSKW